MLLIGRFIAGIGVGWVCVSSPMYVSESVSSAYRGAFLMVSFLAQAVGSFVAVLLGLAVRYPPGSDEYADGKFDRWWWRVVVLLPVLFSSLSFLALSRMSETPYILLKRDRAEEARLLLLEIHGNEADIEEDFQRAKGQADRMMSKDRISPEQRLVRGEKKNEYRHALMVGAFLGLFQNLSGARAIFTSATTIFTTAGLSPFFANVVSAMLLLTNVLSIFASAFFVDGWGRKVLLLLSFAGQALSAFIGAISYWIERENGNIAAVIVSMYLFMISYGFGVAGIPCAYLSEIYPRDFAAFGMGVGAAGNWIGIAVMTFITLTASNLTIFTLLAVISGVAFVFVFIFIRETKDSSVYGSPFFSDEVNVGSA